MTSFMEADLHRVLDLVRASNTASRCKRNQSVRSQPAQHKLRRYRHETTDQRLRSTSSSSSPSLLHAKMKGITAIYGLEKNTASPVRCLLASHETQSQYDGNEEDEAVLRQRLDRRRELYRIHYGSGGLARTTCTSTGLPKLNSLLEAAQQAKQKTSRHVAIAIGAAVLTTGGKIFSACSIESLQDSKHSVCAERVALLKVLSDAPDDGVEALAICSDHISDILPFPCGSCREFLAEFGDFQVFLVNREYYSEQTRSFELFPRARHTATAKLTLGHPSNANNDKSQNGGSIYLTELPSQTAIANSKDKPLEVGEWTTVDVLDWLVDDVMLPQYRDVFERNNVDGCMLLHLEDCDLQLLLGIVHPVHRKRLLVHLDRLKDRELLEQGIDYGQLQDYLAILDRDRIAVVAQLKATFDRMDVNKDGCLDFNQVRAALKALRLNCSAQAVETLFHSASTDGKLSFPAFASAFSTLAMQPAPVSRNDVHKSEHLHGIPFVDIVALHRSFDNADHNKNGTLDKSELVQLFHSLGKDNGEQRAEEWFAACDLNGDQRLSFAEFVLRYTQLTNISTVKLQTVFEAYGPAESIRRKPLSVVKRTFITLFPEIPPEEVNQWCRSYLQTALDVSSGSEQVHDEGKKQTLSTASAAYTISYADFVLAYLVFRSYIGERLKEATENQLKMCNDALSHRSRIVHLQQSGHVRMCPQTQASLTERRCLQLQQQQQFSSHRHKKHTQEREEDGKDGSESENQHKNKQQSIPSSHIEQHVNMIFNRFTKKEKKKDKEIVTKRNRRDDSDSENEGKHADSNDDDEADGSLSVLEAAQAMTELGVVCSREQIMRLFQAEGFNLQHRLDRREFRRLFRHLKALREARTRTAWRLESSRDEEEIIDHHKKMQHMAALLRGEYGVHRNRQDYDNYLLTQKKMGGNSHGTKSIGSRRPWKAEMQRIEREKQKQRRSKELEESKDKYSSPSGSSESSSEKWESRRRRRAGKNSKSSHRKRTSRSRSRRPNSSTSSATSSTIESTESESERSYRHQHRQKAFSSSLSNRDSRRGFEVGDRITTKTHGNGTLIRIYRDYFVADVHFDNGKKLKNIDLSHLKRLAFEEDKLRALFTSKRSVFRVGMTVLVAHKSTKTASRKGKIIKCRTDGTFDVLVDEFGEAEMLKRVPLHALRLIRKPVVYTEGSKVKVKQRYEYLRGTVMNCRADGTYDIQTRRDKSVLKRIASDLLSPDDQEDEKDQSEDEETDKVSSKQLQQTKRKYDEEEDEGKNQDEDDDYNDFEPEFEKGEAIEARFQGKDAYYRGKIAKVYTDGTYDIVYDDGDEETRVKSHLIRGVKIASAQAASSSSSTNKKTVITTKTKATKDDYDEDLFESD